jgi:hypothetical protein
VSLAPTSNSIILEQAAQGRDPDTWNELMERALSGLNCQVIQSTSAEAPGLLAYVEHHLGAHHSPDFFHAQHELVKAVSGPLATKQRAASKAASEAQARLDQAQEHLAPTGDAPNSQAPDNSPQAPLSLEQAQHEAQAASQELERISIQRAQVAQSIRGIGQAYHWVDVERGGRRNGQLMAADIQSHIDTMCGVAQHEALWQSCCDRIDKAQRVVPKMQATNETPHSKLQGIRRKRRLSATQQAAGNRTLQGIDFVSGSGRDQVRGLDLAPSGAYALHAHLMPACSLERVAQTRTVKCGRAAPRVGPAAAHAAV